MVNAQEQQGSTEAPVMVVNGDASHDIKQTVEETSQTFAGTIEQQMQALHRFAAEGDVAGVRGILSQSRELLESIDPVTGLTPMLQAIYAGQVETVKELTLAGAYPPPASVTQDPAILSILYPAHQHLQQQSHHLGQPPFQPGAAPQEFSQLHGLPPRPAFGAHSKSMDGKDVTNLPPVEVSKSIPCRNFPNCRYGDACAFQHPGQAGVPPQFFPTPFASEFVPGAPYSHQGYPPMQPPAGVFYGSPFPPAAFIPNGPIPFPHHQQQSHPRRRPSELQQPQHASMVHAQQARISPSQLPAAIDETSSDAAAKQGELTEDGSKFASMAISRGPGFPTNAPFEHRKSFHHKKMSFSGGKPGPWATAIPNARSAVLGQWTNGVPPPCVFFQLNKCRNGEMCKFPHLLPDGTDCRHPDVISGSMAPVTNSTGPRVPRTGRLSLSNGLTPEGAHIRSQHLAAMNKLHTARVGANTNGLPPVGEVATAKSEQEVVAPVSAETEKSAAASSAPVTIAAPTPASATAPAAAVVPAVAAATATPRAAGRSQSTSRSAPNTRAVSPTQSTNSSARPERSGKRQVNHATAQANGRSSSIPPAAKEPKQRVPNADEFPVLAGSVGSLSSSTTLPSQGKTAAQVLSAPAPPKPVAVKAEASVESSDAEVVKVAPAVSNEDNVTFESDDEAVIVSHTPTPKAAPAAPRAPMSFAAIAGNSAPAAAAAPDAAATVALQA